MHTQSREQACMYIHTCKHTYVHRLAENHADALASYGVDVSDLIVKVKYIHVCIYVCMYVCISDVSDLVVKVKHINVCMHVCMYVFMYVSSKLWCGFVWSCC